MTLNDDDDYQLGAYVCSRQFVLSTADMFSFPPHIKTTTEQRKRRENDISLDIYTMIYIDIDWC